jgi:SRSO17 transposase
MLLAIGLVGGSGPLPMMDGSERVRWQASQPWWGRRGRAWRVRRGRRGKAASARPSAVAPGPAFGTEHDEAEPAELPLHDPARWGLNGARCAQLPAQLQACWESFADCFRTQTRDTSCYAYQYVAGLLRMDHERNFAAIGRATGVGGDNVQHFMTYSPWSSAAVVQRLQALIKTTPGLGQGAVLLLDESADEKAGDQTAGAGRQYNGRLGKVDMSQVGVFLAYANVVDAERPFWAWIDGRLFVPLAWFAPEMARQRQLAGLPERLAFKTKIQLGWEMIEQAFDRGPPFELVAFDSLYGRSAWLRDQVHEHGGLYMAEVPRSTLVYCQPPVLGVPERKPGARGAPATRSQVLNDVPAVQAHTLATPSAAQWRSVRVRSTARGWLKDQFAARRVWTLRDDGAKSVCEWLVMRREPDGRCSFALSNAPADTPLARLAWLKCQRYFVERANEEAKATVGWAEFRARKYRAWQHHLVLVILAVWFLAHTRWCWARTLARDPRLKTQLGLDHLPPLSLANIRLLLQAVMPLAPPSPDQALALVTGHLVNRARSRRSRLKAAYRAHGALAPP